MWLLLDMEAEAASRKPVLPSLNQHACQRRPEFRRRGGWEERKGEPIPVHLPKEIHIVPWIGLAEIRPSEVGKGQENK